MLALNKHRPPGQRGFTLIELLTTVSIAAVLMMVAVPSMVSFKRNSELTSATNSLFSAINAARGEAMKRGAYAMVVPTGNGNGTAWATGWVVFVDSVGSHDRVYSAADDNTVLTQAALPSYFTVSGNATASENPAYIMFDASGYSKTKTAGFGALTLTIRRNDVTGNSAAKCEQTRSIVIDAVGRARTCKPTSNTDLACPVVGTPC